MKNQIFVSALALTMSASAMAAVSAEEAKQLGTTLTEFGAIRAGNADGSIPAYTGGLTRAPAGFKPDSGFWIDPFKDEKPVLRIDAKNVDQHAAKLSEGQKQLLKKFPTYAINVYPSHRTATFPEKMLKATVRNATGCKTLKDGLALDVACRGGLPFAIPKNGYEVMWNQILRYQGDTTISTTASRSWVIDSSGKPTISAQQLTVSDFTYYQTDLTDRDPNMAWRVYSINNAPARRAGEMTGLTDFLDPTDKPRRAWSYTPGQRRVKLSPEFSYDQVCCSGIPNSVERPTLCEPDPGQCDLDHGIFRRVTEGSFGMLLRGEQGAGIEAHECQLGTAPGAVFRVGTPCGDGAGHQCLGAQRVAREMQDMRRAAVG